MFIFVSIRYFCDHPKNHKILWLTKLARLTVYVDSRAKTRAHGFEHVQKFSARPQLQHKVLDGCHRVHLWNSLSEILLCLTPALPDQLNACLLALSAPNILVASGGRTTFIFSSFCICEFCTAHSLHELFKNLKDCLSRNYPSLINSQ